MGQEIAAVQFHQTDFDRFHQKLIGETQRLQNILQAHSSATDSPTVGLELESWLITKDMYIAPINDYFLRQLHNPLVNAELAKFNIEFNTHPVLLKEHALSQLHQELQNSWSLATQQAQMLDSELLMIGILPTLEQEDLNISNMSDLNRYRALNEQILAARDKPVQLDITGIEHLKLSHYDVMLESAATSLQLHTRVPNDIAHHFYNAAIIASAYMVAIAANSPFLFGKCLWHETRIPLFEQSIETGGYAGASHGPVKRVSFGSDFARHSIFECFQENLEHFPVLLPVNLDDSEEQLPHLRLHNGTIWRWNRPLVGFDNGTPHIRIEHRTPAAGPSMTDTIANAAFFFGLSHALCQDLIEGHLATTFSEAKDNFYQAARYGLDAHITDFGGQHQRIQQTIIEQCLPKAHAALANLGISEKDSTKYLNVIEQRARKHQTGSDWQIAFINKHGRDFQKLTRHYLFYQQQDLEVSQWPI